MQIKLFPQWSEYLRQHPESGMGYHMVNVRFSNGSFVSNCIASNCESVEIPQHMVRFLPVTKIEVVKGNGVKR